MMPHDAPGRENGPQFCLLFLVNCQLIAARGGSNRASESGDECVKP